MCTIEFKNAGGGFEVDFIPYTNKFSGDIRQEIRINCFSCGSKTFVKEPELKNRDEVKDCYTSEKMGIMNNNLEQAFRNISQKVDELIEKEMKKLGFNLEQN